MECKPIEVFVVEDNPADATFLRIFFEESGFSIKMHVAENGELALKLLTSTCPDLIIIDLNVPRIDGLQLVKEISADPQHPPIVVLSSSANPADAEGALQAGANSYLVKRTQLAEFMKELEVVKHWIQAILQTRS